MNMLDEFHLRQVRSERDQQKRECDAARRLAHELLRFARQHASGAEHGYLDRLEDENEWLLWWDRQAEIFRGEGPPSFVDWEQMCAEAEEAARAERAKRQAKEQG